MARHRFTLHTVVIILVAVGCLVAIGITAFKHQKWRAVWLPWLERESDPVIEAAAGGTKSPGDEGHAPPVANASIRISANGLKNVGYKPLVLEPRAYERFLTLPAIVVERPGRSQLHITAPLTGIVTEIHAVTGEAVDAGEPLFELRLTHEELVAAQRDFLQTIANLEIVEREIERLEGLDEGVIAGRRVLEKQYERQKLEVSAMAEVQAMLLHGLSEEQVGEIRVTQQLFRNVTVRTPPHVHDEEHCEDTHLYTVQSLGVAKGEQVQVGQEMAVLADHCELLVEGLAFEDDAAAIRAAAEARRTITARLVRAEDRTELVEGLQLLYVADQIDPDSRALKVYLRLPNAVARESREGSKRFLEWRYKPGQRMQIGIPVETWEDQFVLPTTAVVAEPVEAFVFRQNGDRFEQIAVHVVHRDQQAVVIANDGTLFPGDVLAATGAYQMYQALKNQAGGGIDPHAGHNH